jgi:hypothetical protein
MGTAMKLNLIAAVFLWQGGIFLPGPITAWSVPGQPLRAVQEDDKPLSKADIIAMLKQTEPRRTQGDISVEIHRRGITFPVDIKTLEEFKQAGARLGLLDAIRKAAEESVRPKLEVPGPERDEAPPTDEDRDRLTEEAVSRLPLIEQARYHALDFAKDLPNFVVTQMVTRTVQVPRLKKWQFHDKLEIELTYRADKGEEFKLLTINGAPTTQVYEDLDASTSTGEFGSVLTALFAPQSRTEFREVKHEMFHGRETVVFDYSVKKVDSRSRLTDKTSHRTVITAYSGSIWVDKDTKRVLRIESSSEDIPTDFPISMSENAVEYDWVTIAGERYLLPIHAEVLLGHDSEKTYTKNIIEFRNYHKFEGTIKVVPN